MQVQIDPEKCMGHARCYSMAPDLLSEDDEGFVAERGSTVEVAPGLEGQARDAANACPEAAILLLQSAPTSESSELQ